MYYQYDEETETIKFYGFNAGETTRPAGAWEKKSAYFSNVVDGKGKDTGLYDDRIDGIYSHGSEMEWYMYWPIFSNQIISSQNYLKNDYYYE